MRKIIELDDHFSTGEQTLQVVLPLRGGRIDVGRVSKTASEALDYIKNVSAEPGKTHLLLLAMGAEETYGPNRNGDGFSEFPVAARGKTAGDGAWWVAPGQELTRSYKTFETNPAHAFKHHQNKDPSRASGVVKRAFWNARMHRVELLTQVDNEKDAEWVQRVEAGEFPAVSMGCRIKYDVCSRCGNKAPTRADYCKHAQMMNEVNPDGTKNFVYNPDADFFDISRVFRPADRIGYTLKKVAEVCRRSADLGFDADLTGHKASAARKLSTMDKVINGRPVALDSLEADERWQATNVSRYLDHVPASLTSAPPISREILQGHGIRSIKAATDAAGIVLRDGEFVECVVSELEGRPACLSSSTIQKVAEAAHVAIQLFAESPSLLDHVLDGSQLHMPGAVSERLASSLARLQERRAYAGDMLYRKLVPEGVGLRPDEEPATDLLQTERGTTTRGAVTDARDATARAHTAKTLGGAALLLGGYKMLTAYPWLRRAKIPLAVGVGALGHKVLSHEEPGIPSITEMAPKTAAILHLLECRRGSAATVDISRAKVGALTDLIQGLLLEPEAVATFLGDTITA